MPLTYAITGCSSGIGLDLVKFLAARGDKVYALVRKRTGSKSGSDALSGVEGDVTIIEGIDTGNDNVGGALKQSVLQDVTIDVLINNAGISGSPQGDFSVQSLDNMTMDGMRECFEVNTLGPLRVTQALQSNLKQGSGKVAIISTGLASIQDNTSGGMYAYRTSKAAVNMVSKCLAADLQKNDKGIAVVSIAPGFVATNFAGNSDKMNSWGAKPVRQATEGIVQIIEDLTVETSGKFMLIPSDGSAIKEQDW